MTSIGVIAEGITDYHVIRQVLYGHFALQEDRALHLHSVFPPEEEEVGGWTVLKSFLRDGGHREALAFADYLVLHIDTDVCDAPGFDVERSEHGRTLPPDVLRARVIDKLCEWMDSPSEAERERMLFAVAIDSIECWFLPLLSDAPATRRKTAGCLDTANRLLRKKGRDPLSKSDSKLLDAYRAEAKPYGRFKTLGKKGPKNPSLQLFLTELEARAIQLDTEDEE